MTEVTSPSRVAVLTQFLAHFFGGWRLSDFQPREEQLALRAVRTSGFFLIAPAAITATVVASWWFFPAEEGTDSLGLFYGTASIVLMSWALVLSTRMRVLEWAFGGFDRLHIWHRWSGIAAVAFLLLHSNAENDVRNGVVPFGRAIEETGVSLGDVGQTVLITLIVISILRVLPYRLWRFSHIGLIVPFGFSAFHVLTAERPFTESAPGSVWLWVWSVVGLAAFTYRLVVVDSGWWDRVALVSGLDQADDSVTLTLTRRGDQPWAPVTPGQFVFIRLRGYWRESHPFSVTSLSPDHTQITLHVRHAGDWTRHLSTRLAIGDRVLVSRFYGHLQLTSRAPTTVWIAGGSGVTPFLQDRDFLANLPTTPRIVYFFRGESRAIGLDQLRQSGRNGLIELVQADTSQPGVNKSQVLGDAITAGSHVAVCGPSALISQAIRVARAKGARSVSYELYDYRSPFGPDLNPLLMAIVHFILPSSWRRGMSWLADTSKPADQKELTTTR